MKRLKAIVIAILTAITIFAFAACGTSGNTPDNGNPGVIVGGDEQPEKPNDGNDNNINGDTDNDNTDDGDDAKDDDAEDKTDDGKTKILVAYFSCTNTTKGRAESLQSKLEADIYQIVPTVAYTSADLNYNTDCRANREQNDSKARPEISGGVDDMAQYDVVYIGYPIWWGQAPKIIYTFLESYDFSGKTLIPFCTSASSGMGSSGTNLHASAPDAVWKSGCRVGSSGDIDALVNMK